MHEPQLSGCKLQSLIEIVEGGAEFEISVICEVSRVHNQMYLTELYLHTRQLISTGSSSNDHNEL